MLGTNINEVGNKLWRYCFTHEADLRIIVIGMRISPDEAGKINLTDGIKTKNGDHVVEVGFIHNIHCLVSVVPNFASFHQRGRNNRLSALSLPNPSSRYIHTRLECYTW